jgi:hypothetical protein
MSENGGTLTVYQRMNDPLQAVNELGTAIAKSGMFGCGSIDQGKVLALECLARGMPPLTLAERYHVVQGKLMMKYDAMLAEFHAMGGKHRIISRTEEKAEIELLIDGERHVETLTWDQAKQEKWPFKSDGKSIKDNWATPKARRQMLWARVVSEGVRALRPGVNNGRYVAEEIEGDDPPHAGNGHAAAPAAPAPAAKPVDPAKAAAVDVPFEVKVSPNQPGAAVTSPQPAASTQAESTPRQWDDIRQLFDTLYGHGTEKRHKTFDAALAKRNAKSLSDLSAAQADEIIAALRSKVESTRAAADAALPRVEPPSPAEDPTTASSGPCTPELDAQIKSELQQWKQIDPATYDKEFVWLKGKLAESKRAKIAELSYGDAKKLLAAVQTRNLASFIQASLQPKVVATPEPVTA